MFFVVVFVFVLQLPSPEGGILLGKKCRIYPSIHLRWEIFCLLI